MDVDSPSNIFKPALKGSGLQRIGSFLFAFALSPVEADMGSFPRHFFSLTVTSLCISTIGMVFAALTIDLSPIVWLIPGVIALTFIYNTFILLVASAETYNSRRLYAPTPIGCAYFLTFLWTASLAAATAITVLLFANVIQHSDGKIKIWMSIIAGVSLLEAILLGVIAVMSHRELKQIRYKDKWYAPWLLRLVHLPNCVGRLCNYALCGRGRV